MQHGMYITMLKHIHYNKSMDNWNIKSLPHNSQIIATQNEDYLIFVGGTNAHTKTTSLKQNNSN